MSKITETANSAPGDLMGARSGSDAGQSEESSSEAIQPAAEAAKIRTRRSAGGTKELASEHRVGEVTPAEGPYAQDVASTKVQKKLSKHHIVLELLRRDEGATIDELIDATAWQAHSVRGFLSGTVRKKLKLNLISDVVGNGVRRYRVTSGGGNDATPDAYQPLPSSPPSEHPVTDDISTEQAG